MFALAFEVTKAFFVKYREKIAVIGVGHIYLSLFNHWFDFILYPFVIWSQGFLNGSLIMISLAFLSDIITIFFYDRTKKDWFGIEIAKDIQDSISSKSVAAVLKWTRNSGDLVTAVALSFLIDPLLIMLYMRHGSNQYNWISKRDWKIFLTATVVGNVYWATLIYLGIESVEYIAG